VGNGDNQEGDRVSKVYMEECGGKNAIRIIQRRDVQMKKVNHDTGRTSREEEHVVSLAVN